MQVFFAFSNYRVPKKIIRVIKTPCLRNFALHKWIAHTYRIYMLKHLCLESSLSYLVIKLKIKLFYKAFSVVTGSDAEKIIHFSSDYKI